MNLPLTLWTLLLGLAATACSTALHPPSSQTAQPAPRNLSIDMQESVEIEFVWLEPLGIWAGRYEVTNAQYRRFMRFRESGQVEGLDLLGDEQPAVFVSFCDALGFAHWLNQNTELPQGFQARLPSGEEWTQMAQAGSRARYSWGDSWPPSSGNLLDHSAHRELGPKWGTAIQEYRDGFAVTAPVSQTSANRWGLHGLAGNVGEWTTEEAQDSQWRMIRGGSWREGKRERLGLDFRREGAIWGKDNYIGFRIVLGPASGSPSMCK